MGWLQSIRKLGIHVQELHATVPQCTFHDGVGGHFWGIELQAWLQIVLHVIQFLYADNGQESRILLQLVQQAGFDLVKLALLFPVLARELPLATDILFLGISIGHQCDIEDLQDHQPRREELSDQEIPAARAQCLVVEAHIDRWGVELLEGHL